MCYDFFLKVRDSNSQKKRGLLRNLKKDNKVGRICRRELAVK